MHKFSYWQEGLVFSIVFLVVIAVPCVLIYDLGQRPTKGAKAHLDLALPLIGTMILSFGLLVGFYKYFSD